MHWHLLVERLWHDQLPGLASAKIPRSLHGQERIEFYQSRAAAQQRITTLFPLDEE